MPASEALGYRGRRFFNGLGSLDTLHDEVVDSGRHGVDRHCPEDIPAPQRRQEHVGPFLGAEAWGEDVFP